MVKCISTLLVDLDLWSMFVCWSNCLNVNWYHYVIACIPSRHVHVRPYRCTVSVEATSITRQTLFSLNCIKTIIKFSMYVGTIMYILLYVCSSSLYCYYYAKVSGRDFIHFAIFGRDSTIACIFASFGYLSLAPSVFSHTYWKSRYVAKSA